MRKKVLIISYYWPPAGGAGVQRWLKLSKYLCRLGLEVFVLTVDEKYASYIQIDESLLADIHPDVHVFKTKSFEPIRLYARIFGKEKVPTAGFSNVDNTRWSQKLINSLRSHLFIPDPRKTWNPFAIRKAREIIDTFGIEHIITTSPPHSTQLIGLRLKKIYNLHWICDLRDPWTDIYYYQILGHSVWSRMKDQKLEKTVLEKADKIITVSEGFKSLFLNKSDRISEEKISVIPNGFDAEDFKPIERKSNNNVYTICYTGTMSDQYHPRSFFDALSAVAKSRRDSGIKFQSVGIISEKIRNYIISLGLQFEHIPTVPHEKVIQFQKQADLLLLVIPKVDRGEGIIPGKLFEYLASGNRIISLGPEGGDVKKILEETGAGQNFAWNAKKRIRDFLSSELLNFPSVDNTKARKDHIQQYSREYQAGQVFDIINALS